MKHLISLFVSLMIAMTIQAHDHLTFMGIPIDGPIDKMVAALAEKGLTDNGKITENIAQMSFYLNGQPIDVLLVADEQTGNVYRVSVMTQPKFKWKTLKREYEMYQKQFFEQYGVPTTYEMFMYPYNTKKKMRKHGIEALINDKVVWSSFFKEYGADDTLIGDVSLAITPYAHLARVVIYFEDALNSPVEEQNKFDN